MISGTAIPYKPTNHIRIVTAASLFDGHDAAINIMRRIIQATGVEVIHLGHNRSVDEIVNCAIQEDVQAIAITSYQGGHLEFFKYTHDLLKENGRGDIKIFGGGGGTFLPNEIEELHAYGITKIYSPDDGRAMGLQGMINHLVESSDFSIGKLLTGEKEGLKKKDAKSIARLISAGENFSDQAAEVLAEINMEAQKSESLVLGITGTGGAGKSSLVDELVRRFLADFDERPNEQSEKTIAIISVDPSKRKTGGALLGDRIRMNSINHPRVYIRSLATRQSNLALSKHVKDAINIVKAAHFDLIILETSGIGQSDTEIIDHSDLSLYVMTPEYGAATQLEKIDMLDFADLVAVNKFDKKGALDALRDVKKQYKRNKDLWESSDDELPVYGTIASQFNDPGMNALYAAILNKLAQLSKKDLKSRLEYDLELTEKLFIIPPNRIRYLSEIAEELRKYDEWIESQSNIAQNLYSIHKTKELVKNVELKESLETLYDELSLELDLKNQDILKNWETKKEAYCKEKFTYQVRNKNISVNLYSESLSHSKIPKVCFPKYEAWGDVLKWSLQENVPGEFPYTAGVFHFKREEEDPTRMFAGEGGPERTNRRFHYVSKGLSAVRLSTAFDSITLY